LEKFLLLLHSRFNGFKNWNLAARDDVQLRESANAEPIFNDSMVGNTRLAGVRACSGNLQRTMSGISA
jgi:hypothetical protein